MGKKEQNEIFKGLFEGSDLKEREQEVLKDASEKLGFEPTSLMGRSSWWGSSEIGAFHYIGNFEGKKAVLKIQGVKPQTSEIYMIQSFAKTNRSSLVRPPHLYASLPWSEEARYEALVLENINGDQIIHSPTNDEELRSFFKVYQEYRHFCLSSPWVEKPTQSISEKIADNFEKWREASFKVYPHHPLRKKEDDILLGDAVSLLVDKYRGVETSFMHGHFSAEDLYQVGNQIVILSNLYWSWRQPLYDAIFAYHWRIYHLNATDDITPNEVESQRSLWLTKIRSLPQVEEYGENLLNLALLERAAAGLNLDGLASDPKKPISVYLLDATREQIKKLMERIA